MTVDSSVVECGESGNVLQHQSQEVTEADGSTPSLLSSDESAGEMLQRLGTDGMLWAQEMNKHFPSVSVADLLGWCCNMIEAGGDRERRRVVYDGSGMFFISAPEHISESAFERLKKQIDDIWPSNVLRPIFLEGCKVEKL